MLHFIGILSPREDFAEGDDRQKPFFGPELRLSPDPRKKAEPDDRRPRQTDPAETMRFAALLAPPFL
ncbi:hypothetical protein [Devosia sp.]|uniref:hypothetical protein n=1 Tax=Devosia sp. TaxID=1871048 RepID=UPI001AD47414|nr:hypothetical protein [Devosia sp.]MBN9311286.1 hypothetical protein [Devosia sp.]